MDLVERILEPELMLDEEQARAYAAVDFSEPHNRYVELLASRFPAFSSGVVLDLGCGTGDVAIRMARRFPGCRITGVDGSAQMLRCAAEAIEAADLAGRIGLVEGFIPDAELPEE